MSDLGGSVSWIAGVATGAAVVCWGLIPAMNGLGTQRSPVQGDLAKPGDVFQWLGANVARVSGDFAVTFQKDKVQGPVAGSTNVRPNVMGEAKGPQLLPSSYQPEAPSNDLGADAVQSGMSGGEATYAPQDLNRDGIVDLDEMGAGQ